MSHRYNTKKTTRRPRFTMNRESDDDMVDMTIQRQASDMAPMIFQMLHPDAVYESVEGDVKKKLNATRGWDTFSNHDASQFQDPDSAQTFKTASLEEFHDMVHDFVGQGENAPGMRDTPDAPFDPDKASLGQMGDPAYAGVRTISSWHEGLC